jgi:oligoribonuclease (3'-5' exoribonuclease)
MAKTNDFELCEQYLISYIEDMNKQMNEYQIKLAKQSELYPIIPISFEQIDHCLHEFIDCQRNYLSTRNNNQSIKFTDDITENKLFESITRYFPTLDQVSIYRFLFFL